MNVIKKIGFLVAGTLLLTSCSSDSQKIEGLTKVFTDGNLRSLVSLENEIGDLSCRYYKNNGKDTAELKMQVNLKLNFEAPFFQTLTEEEAKDQITNVRAYFTFYDSEFEKIGSGIGLELEDEEFFKFCNFLKGKKGSTESFVFTKSDSRADDEDVKGLIKTINYFVPEGIAAPLSWDLWGTLSSYSTENGYLGESILAAYTEVWEGLVNPSQKIDPKNTVAATNRGQILLGISKDLTEDLMKYPDQLSPEQYQKYNELEEKYTKIMKDRMPNFSENEEL